jgi:20S proteasome subunit alpha 7
VQIKAESPTTTFTANSPLSIPF